MSFQDLVQASQKYFPDLQIKYKTDSTLMKLLGKLLFFNKSFMTSYTTTVGSSVYFPSQPFVKVRPISAAIILLHELVHVKDSKKISQPIFGALYLSPQILIFLLIPLLFVSWKIALPFLVLAAPIPSFFRMYYEKRAYIASLYVMSKLGKRLSFDPMLDKQKVYFENQFKGSYYYFMWPFSGGLNKDFDQAVEKIRADQRPFEDPVFDMLDDLVSKV
jgi:hypothetical protein